MSFCVPQVVQIAESYRRGIKRAKDNGIEPGKCFSVIMIGRLDDYLSDVAKDYKADISESDIQQAGLAATKRAYTIYKERGYEGSPVPIFHNGTNHHAGHNVMLLPKGLLRIASDYSIVR